MVARVRTGGRLHFGFRNLSVSRERLYGSVGVALSSPALEVIASISDGISVDCQGVSTELVNVTGESGGQKDGGVVLAESSELEHTVTEYVRHATDICDVPGATVTLDGSMPRHVGLGSGTQFALAIVKAVAAAADESVDIHAVAPRLGRGGRSGVGVAAFESGGFIVDEGHPADLFTAGPPAPGEWTVPPVRERLELPASWRFVLVRPAVAIGRDGNAEDDSMRRVIERADPSRAIELGSILEEEILPAVDAGDVERFGAGVERFNRANGEWYTSEQGGVYRPPVGAVVSALSEADSVFGAGQSSWGPLVFGVTTTSDANRARLAGERALDTAGVDGWVQVVAPSNTRATVEPGDDEARWDSDRG